MNIKTEPSGQHEKLEYTFDNPAHPYARWGVLVASPRQGVVRLAYIGTGYPAEIKGCRKYRTA